MPTTQITGADVGTIDLNDNVNCQIAEPGWIPAVSRRKKGAMGNQSLYEDVVETIPLRVFSEHATPATARQQVMDWLHDLSAALDQAGEWKAGMTAANAVLFNFKAQDSSLANPLIAAILGVPDDAPGLFEFKGSYNQGLQVYEIFVDLVFIRRGALLGPESDVTSSTVNNCEKMSVTLPAALDLLSPTKVNMGTLSNSGNNRNWKGLILISDASDKIGIYDAEDAGPVGDWTVVSASGTFARNNNVLQFAPSSTIEQGPNLIDLTSGVNQSAKLFAIYFNAKNSSSTEHFHVRFKLTGIQEEIYTRKTTVLAGATNPTWYYGGMVALEGGAINWLNLLAQPSGISSTPTLQIDTIVVAVLDDSSHQVALPVEQSGSNSMTVDKEISIDHAALTRPDPGVSVVGTPAGETFRGPIPFLGNAYIYTKGTDVVVVYLSTGGNSPTHWRRTNNAGTAPQQFYAQVRRRAAYMVPR